MVAKKVTIERVSAVENLFGRYISDAKNEVTVNKKRKKTKEINPTDNQKLQNKEKKSRKSEKLGKDENESCIQSEKSRNKAKQNKKNHNSPSTEESPKAFKTFENPITKLAELFFTPNVKSEYLVNTKDKDRLCQLISSLFNSTDKTESQFTTNNRPKIIIKETESLRIMKKKLLKKNKKQQRRVENNPKSEHTLHSQRKKKHKKHKSQKHENKIKDIKNKKQNIDVIKLLNANTENEHSNYTNTNHGISTFSYRNTNKIITELLDKSKHNKENNSVETNIEHIQQERLYHLGHGDGGKLNSTFLNYMICQRDEGHQSTLYLPNENHNIIEQIHNLAKMISISRSEISYMVQFSSTDRGTLQQQPHRRTFSSVMEDSHFGGKPLIYHKGCKDRHTDEVNVPVDSSEYMSSTTMTREESEIDQIYEDEIKKNKEAMEKNKIKPNVGVPDYTYLALENTLTEPKKQKTKKKKPNMITQILRKCLCLGKPKSVSDISTISDEKIIDINTTRHGKRYWHSTVNQVYTVEDDPARGFKPTFENHNKSRKRPSFKINTIKGRSKGKLKKMKSSELNCCIEWKGQNEGNIKFGKNSKKKCLHFKIDRWTKIEDDKDGERSYSLQAVLLPE